MDKALKKNNPSLSVLAEIKSAKLLKVFLQESDDSLILALSEFANKVANKRFISTNQPSLEKLSNKTIPITVKRKLLIKLGPDFMRELLKNGQKSSSSSG